MVTREILERLAANPNYKMTPQQIADLNRYRQVEHPTSFPEHPTGFQQHPTGPEKQDEPR